MTEFKKGLNNYAVGDKAIEQIINFASKTLQELKRTVRGSTTELDALPDGMKTPMVVQMMMVLMIKEAAVMHEIKEERIKQSCLTNMDQFMDCVGLQEIAAAG